MDGGIVVYHVDYWVCVCEAVRWMTGLAVVGVVGQIDGILYLEGDRDFIIC